MLDPLTLSQQLRRDGNVRLALNVLKNAAWADPGDLRVRRALAEMYREMGYPDQAGRWGIVLDGWTTAKEKEELVKDIAYRGEDDLVKFLNLPSGPHTFPDLHDLLAGPVKKYMEPSSGRWRETLFGIAAIGWSVSTIAFLIGSIAVTVLVTAELGDPAGVARLIGCPTVVLAGLSTSIYALSARAWWAPIVGVVGLLCTGAGVIAFVHLAGLLPN
ncbi:DUF6584 family protein [Mycetocola zhujimingii]|uniref:DUF6584 family protein n=1 Tax=Mycetocola zhujimingii TaxID=2079792 RepID=UPI000D38EAAB|nr:DUF6584 family protein [Mycetocola zhujimingii]AWB86001.1 hypothetical protein C3E77_04820 [Mycetocola zhujimingii]